MRGVSKTTVGSVLTAIGFLAGSLAAVVDKTAVRWSWFVCALGTGALGFVLIRWAETRRKQMGPRVTSDILSLESSLSRIVDRMRQLNTEKHTINPYDMPQRIDELFADDLDTFVAARETIAHAYGLNVYADVMSSFAAGERYLNRVWSASADGYVDEANTYLEKAQDQFSASLRIVQDLHREHVGSSFSSTETRSEP